ncbi:MAG: ankyrin repeat domain-containing protein [Vicinamibacterales bacterium]
MAFAVLTSVALGAAGDQRLIQAVKAGEVRTVQTLLAQRVDVNATEPDGTTALHWAVHNGDVALVERLLRAGANVKTTNLFGVTPLSEASVAANTAILAALLKAGADVNARTSDGQTALMAVARTGNIEAARLLVERGADVNAKESWLGQSALMWAASDNLPLMVKELIGRGADVNARSTVHNWERDVTAEPRQKYMPRGGWTPLLFAARDGALDAATVLVESGADLDLQDPDLVSPVVMAIVNGHFDVARLLVEKGADVNLSDRWGRTALWAAVDMHTPLASERPEVAERGSVSPTDLLQAILARGADVNAQLILFPPFRSLADRGNDTLLTIGATPMLRAAKGGDIVAMKLLMQKGADIRTPNLDGITPLLAAAGVGSRDSDTRGRYKTQKDAVEAVTLLLDAGADVNAADNQGRTALHGAAFWGFNDLVRTLVARGARVDAKDRQGRTPVDSAMGRAGGNGFGGNRIDVHADTAALLEQLRVP